MQGLSLWIVNAMLFDIPESQWRCYRLWLISIALAETVMLVCNRHLVECYGVIAVLFLCGFLLRVFRLYPGENEPLVLDASAAVIAVIYALAARAVGDSGWRFALIVSSSVIILPHVLYIARVK